RYRQSSEPDGLGVRCALRERAWRLLSRRGPWRAPLRGLCGKLRAPFLCGSALPRAFERLRASLFPCGSARALFPFLFRGALSLSGRRGEPFPSLFRERGGPFPSLFRERGGPFLSQRLCALSLSGRRGELFPSLFRE